MAEQQEKYISLQVASGLCKYSQEYLGLRARSGKLKAIKLGRNWVTKNEWLEEYVALEEKKHTKSIQIKISNSQQVFPVQQPPKFIFQFVCLFVFVIALLFSSIYISKNDFISPASLVKVVDTEVINDTAGVFKDYGSWVGSQSAFLLGPFGEFVDYIFSPWKHVPSSIYVIDKTTELERVQNAIEELKQNSGIEGLVYQNSRGEPGPAGPPGLKGDKGEKGEPGQPGISSVLFNESFPNPVVNFSGNYADLNINHGKFTVSELGNIYTIGSLTISGDTISDFTGSGLNLSNGALTVNFSNDVLSVATLTINSAFTLPNSDGTNGQALITDGAGNVAWETVATGGGTWGTITGTLSAQTDLQNALNLKLDKTGGTMTGTLNTSTLTINSAFTFPTIDGNANYVLKTDGSGTLRWEADATGGAPTWGTISGTLSAQTDLQTALNGKLATTGGTISSNLTILGVTSASSISASNLVLGTDSINDLTGNHLSISGGALTVENDLHNYSWTNVTDADIPDTITASNYLLLTGGTVTGTLNTATLTVNSAFSFPKTDGTNGYTLKTNGSGSLYWSTDNNAGTWGSITGTLSAQTDLQTALDGKLATAGGTISGNLTVLGVTSMGGNLVLNGHWLSGDGGNEGVYVDASGNVGIGTTTPLGKLHVVGGSYTATSLAEMYNSNTFRIQDRSNTNSSLLVSDIDSTNNIKIGIQGASSTTVANDISLQPYGGNVGIGTTSPGHLLDVVGSKSGEFVTYLNNTHPTNGYGLAIDAGDDNNVLALQVRNYNGTVAGLVVTGAGNVGIGTTSPGAILTIATSGTTDAFRIGVEGGYFKVTSSGNIGIGTMAPNVPLEITSAGTTGLKITTDAGGAVSSTLNGYTLNLNGASVVASGGALTLNSSSSSIKLSPAGVEKVTILNTGDVGIGTTSPATMLDVNGAITTRTIGLYLDPGLKPRISGTATGEIGFNYNTAGTGSLVWYGGGTTGLVTMQNNGNVGIGTISPGAMLEITSTSAGSANLFKISGASSGSVMTVLNNGNVGIGTTTPGYLLDVNGVLNVATNDVAIRIGGTGIFGKTSAGNFPSTVGYTRFIGDGILFSGKNNNTAQIVINPTTGNIGIGTTTPSSVLEITSAAGTSALFKLSRLSSGDVLTVDSSGNIGVNDSTPDYKFDIEGILNAATITINSVFTFPSTDGTVNQVLKTNGSGSLYWSTDNNSGTWGSITGTLSAQTDLQTALNGKLATTGGTISSNLTILGVTSASSISASSLAMSGNIALNGNYLSGDGGNEGIYVDAAGNVGIGTTSPGVKLQLNDSKIRTSVTGASYYLDMYSDGAGGHLVSNSENLYVGTDTDAALYLTTYGSTRMTILSGGNVGIGDTTPDAILEIVSGTGSPLFMLSGSSTGDGNLLKIDANGNVGIRTTTPAYPLHVEGNKSVPILKSEVVDGVGGFSRLDGASGVFVSGNYAYITASGDNALTIMDITNPASPVLKSETVDGAGGFTKLAGAYSVYVSGNYAYVASSTDNSLTIIDISNPAVPVLKAEVVDGVGGFTKLAGADYVYVSGNYAYVTAASDSALTIIDISNPASPVLKAEIVDGVGGFTKLNWATSVYVSGNYAYVTAGTDDALTIIDITNPAYPVLKSEVVDGVGGFAKLDGANSVFVSGSYAYVASDDDHSLTIIDVSNPASPSLKYEIVNAVGGFVNLLSAKSVYVAGNYAYVVGGSGGLSIIDVSNPAAPTLKVGISDESNGFSKLGYPLSIFVSGNYAYIPAYTDDALTIIDVSGAYISNLDAGFIKTGGLQVMDNLFANGDLNLRGALSSSRALVSGNMGISGILNVATLTVNSVFTFPKTDGTANQTLVTNGSGNLTWSTSSAGLPTTGGTISGNLTILGVTSASAVSASSLRMTGNIALNGNYLSGDGGNEGIYVDASGNVGIGTPSPTSALQIKGNLTLESTDGHTGILYVDNYDRLHVNGIDRFYPTNSEWGFFTEGYSPWASVNLSPHSTAIGLTLWDNIYVTSSGSGGNVGIGNTAPTGRLHLTGSATSGTLFNMDYAANTTLTGDLYGLNLSLLNTTPSTYNTWGLKVSLPASGTGTQHFAQFIEGTTALYDFNKTTATIDVPVSFGAAGDLALSYDLQFTNESQSRIKSYSALSIEAGDPNFNYDLMLSAAGAGTVIVNDNAEVNGILTIDSTSVLPASAAAGATKIYSVNGEGYWMDSAGNITLQTPHDLNTNEWIFSSTNANTGRTLKIQMERMSKFIDETFGTDFVYDSVISESGEITSTSTEQGAEVIQQESEILGWFGQKVKEVLATLGMAIDNGVATVKSLFAEKITTKEICVGETCVNEEQLKQILNRENQSISIEGSGEVLHYCDQGYPELCATPEVCQSAGLFWYENECHKNESGAPVESILTTESSGNNETIQP